MVRHFLSLPFLLLTFFLIIFALITAVVSVVALVCVALCLQLCITTPTNSSLTNPMFRSLQEHPEQEILLMQEEHPVDQTLSALKAMPWTASLPFEGHFCLETNIFNASFETEYDLFQYTTSIYRGSKHIIWFSPSLYPITGGFGKDLGGHSLITNLHQTAKSIGNCSLVSNGSGLQLVEWFLHAMLGK
jgi:hypothetical protein